MITDLRFALRLLAKRPLFSLIAILSLGIGTGVTTATLGVMDALRID